MALSPLTSVIMLLPNMRLKLSGLLSKESAVPSPAFTGCGDRPPCARGHAARSLSAIR